MSAIQYGLECEPGGQPTVLGPTPEPTHTGCPGGYSRPGLIGGWSCPCACHTQQARLDNHYGYCTLSPDHDGPCGPTGGAS